MKTKGKDILWFEALKDTKDLNYYLFALKFFLETFLNWLFFIQIKTSFASDTNNTFTKPSDVKLDSKRSFLS